MNDVCVIGHITRDIIVIKKKNKRLLKQIPGGVAYYFPITLKSLGSNVSLITKIAEKDTDLKNELKSFVDPLYNKSEKEQKTTIFKNIYRENLDIREQFVESVAQPFKTEDIPEDISAKIFHLGPLTKEDIPLKILKLLSRKAKVSLDVQGYVRKIEKNKVKMIDWEEKKEGLNCINILKTDEKEAEILTGEKDIEKAVMNLSSSYNKIDEIIVTRGTKGSLIYSQGKKYDIPAFLTEKAIDPTGCGDTYIAAYIHKRLKSSDIYESGRFAAATATLKLEGSGPFKRTEEDVQNFLNLSN